VFAQMAGQLYSSGSSCSQRLQELYEKYGYFEYRSGSVMSEDPRVMPQIFEDIRRGRDGVPYCDALAGAFRFLLHLNNVGIPSNSVDSLGVH
jgi:hypothetical protein